MVDEMTDTLDTDIDEESPEDFLEHVKYLDENTIDDFFLPRVKDTDGEKVSVEQASYDSPFENQENPGRIEDGISLFQPDAWGPTELVKGLDLYQISSPEGTKSCYFTDQDTIDACTDFDTGEIDTERLKSMLQIYDIDESKIVVSKFTVKEDGIKAVMGVSSENPEYGLGGGTQYFVPHANEYKDSGLLSSAEFLDEENDADGV